LRGKSMSARSRCGEPLVSLFFKPC
jgi:hypothetical protein